MPAVDINVMRTKNPQTKQLEREMINLTFCENQTLVNEFVAAFKKDEQKATKVMENKKGGRILSLFYQFENVSYTLSQDEKGCTNVSIMSRQEEKTGSK
jgi:hypothetical protein